MNLDDFIKMDNEIIELDEGIKYFKKSIKIKKYLNKIKLKLNKSNIENKGPIDSLLKEAYKIAREFEKIEDSFYTEVNKDKRKQMKNDYKALEKKNMELFEIINDETMKKVLRSSTVAVGLVSLILASLSIFGVLDMFHDSIASQIKLNVSKTNTFNRMSKQLTKLGGTGNKLKALELSKMAIDADNKSDILEKLGLLNYNINDNKFKLGISGAILLSISKMFKKKNTYLIKFEKTMKKIKEYE